MYTIRVYCRAIYFCNFPRAKQIPKNSKHRDKHQAQQTVSQNLHTINKPEVSIAASQPRTAQSQCMVVADLKLSQKLNVWKSSQQSNESKSYPRQIASLKQSQLLHEQHSQQRREIPPARIEIFHLLFLFCFILCPLIRCVY